jgi:DNA helicase HerA-like ATPase
VFFFDEAHLLFTDAPKAVLDRIEQVVRLVRSKGVGVFFVTQNPLDIPETVLGQLGKRIQHALRAYTPRDQKAVKTAAQTMRANPALDTEKAITELGVGEALISFLDEKGRPTPVERAFVLPPASRIGPITADERNVVIANSVLKDTYRKTIDRESAYERLGERAGATAPEGSQGGSVSDTVKGSLGGLLSGTGRKDSILEAAAKSAARTVGSTVGREIVRGVLGSLLGRRR